MRLINKNIAMSEEASKIIVDYQKKNDLPNFPTALDTYIKEKAGVKDEEEK